MQEEKLAAVGRLSAVIAHEIRNPVAMISSSLGLAIAHNIVRGHSGLLLLMLNTPETVRFTLRLPRKATSQ